MILKKPIIYPFLMSYIQSAFRTLNDSSKSALIMIFVQCMQNVSQDFFKLDNMSTCMIIVASVYNYAYAMNFNEFPYIYRPGEAAGPRTPHTSSTS